MPSSGWNIHENFGVFRQPVRHGTLEDTVLRNVPQRPGSTQQPLLHDKPVDTFAWDLIQSPAVVEDLFALVCPPPSSMADIVRRPGTMRYGGYNADDNGLTTSCG